MGLWLWVWSMISMYGGSVAFWLGEALRRGGFWSTGT
jgi:hypothetical protein